MDKAVEWLAGLGVPGIWFLGAVAASGWAGAAAISTTLATIGGPGGMVGGVLLLIGTGLVSRAVAAFGVGKVAEALVNRLLEEGISADDIWDRVRKYPVSKSYKDRVFRLLFESA